MSTGEPIQSFEKLRISASMLKAMKELGFTKPTPIQSESFAPILSGKDIVGIAQTGTGKTLAYSLPILDALPYSEQMNPRVLILVPTRELVLQVVDQLEEYSKFKSVRILGLYGGVNIKQQIEPITQGADVVVATPGRLYDLAVSRILQLKNIKQLVIDEVDVMLDLGFRFQLNNIFDLLPPRRQNIMFSATMTTEIDLIIDEIFIKPTRIAIGFSGEPLKNIEQVSYAVPNFYTKVNLLAHLLSDKEEFKKVIVFVGTKKLADKIFDTLEGELGNSISVVHSNKSQNFRIKAIEDFDSEKNRIMISTDVMARGLDLEHMSHVVNFDTPEFPENYIHRIGRTGRAGRMGKSIIFFTNKEEDYKIEIELLMNMEIPELDFPEEVAVSSQLIPEERKLKVAKSPHGNSAKNQKTTAYHKKADKNTKENLGSKWKREGSKKYKKPQRKGDKIQNRNSKKKR
ncbi:MAG: DEAD/DEAH box helicase [Flavobacteriales bacterium]|nr:DEAD/DEAH box helicase [Flavobacteriales bacterium]